MNKDKKIEEMLLERSKESFEKTKQLKIRTYERDLQNVYSDLHDANKDYAELMKFSKEFGLTEYFQKEINAIQNQISLQTKVAAKTIEAIQATKNEQFSPERALQQYAYRHETELKTPRTVTADYEEVSIGKFNEICSKLLNQQKNSLYEEMYDGVESLKEVNQNVEAFNQQQEHDYNALKSLDDNVTEKFSKGLMSSVRATQRMLMVKNMNRVLDKIDLLNEQQEQIIQADLKPEDRARFIENAKETIAELKSQYEKQQMQYEASINASKREMLLEFSPNVTETCLDNLINEAVRRHEELCKEAEQVATPNKEQNFQIGR